MAVCALIPTGKIVLITCKTLTILAKNLRPLCAFARALRPISQICMALLRHVISITNIVKPMRTDDSFVIVSLALSSLLPETRSKAD